MDNVDQSNRQSVGGTRGVDQQFQAAALFYVVNELVLNGAEDQTKVLLLLSKGCHLLQQRVALFTTSLEILKLKSFLLENRKHF